MKIQLFQTSHLKNDPIPALQPDSLHVWILDISCLEMLLPLTALFSSEEKERLSSYRKLQDQTHFLIGHCALRRLLSAYLNLPADHLHFQKLAHDKPALYMPENESTVYFNLSHSGDYVALAFSSESPLGIDIEKYRTNRNLERISRHAFHPDEFLEFCSLSQEEKTDFFFVRWTQKEALLKGMGSGLSLSPASFSLEASDDSDYSAYSSFRIKKGAEVFKSWRICTLSAPVHYALSIAYQPLKPES